MFVVLYTTGINQIHSAGIMGSWNLEQIFFCEGPDSVAFFFFFFGFVCYVVPVKTSKGTTGKTIDLGMALFQ